MKFFVRPLCLALLLVLASVSLARAGDLIDSEVSVDSTGKDSADARSQAMVKGEADALAALLDKLAAPGQSQGIVESLDQKKIEAMVRGTEVLDEHISSNRYRARLKISFDADSISALIGKMGSVDNNDAPATVGSFLIIPGYEEEGKIMLWDDDNPWLNAWKSLAIEINAGDVVVPYGDVKDGAIVTAATLSSATYAVLAPMTLRYGVSDIVILQAKYTDTPEMTLTVVKRRINRQVNEVNLLSYHADPQETKETLLARAARDIVDNLEHKKNEEQTVTLSAHTGEKNSVMVLAKVTTLESWKRMRAMLVALPMVDRLEMLALSPQQIDMVVHYRGTPASLANAITSGNIRLVQNKDYWVISLD